MTELVMLFIVLLLFYFALRVNRMELRLNVMERAINEVVKEGKLDTSYLGKPFGGDAGGLRDFFRAVKTTWKGSK